MVPTWRCSGNGCGDCCGRGWQQELARPPFSVKQREEKVSDVQIGPLHLSVRVDRVDETAGGDLLIDYKTGRAATTDWMSDRPDAPQLPLYAVVSNAERLGGVAFAKLRVGKEMGWKGFVAGEGVLLKPDKLKAESLAAQVDEWREVLTKLAEQFAAGDARGATEELSEDVHVLRAEAAVPRGWSGA